MDALGRFYTAKLISNLLVNSIENNSPKKVLDLGIGDASLSIAGFKRWSKASFFATEIESHKINELESLSFLKVYNYDTLCPKVSATLKIKVGDIDVAICNPPYIKIIEKGIYKKLFKSISCESFSQLKRISSEIIFFSHNLKLLKDNGELGIIVSDSLITNKDFELFRKTIVEKFHLKCIIQLPDKIFTKTEARTYIIVLSKREPQNKTCDLYLSDMNGVLSERISVGLTNIIERMDYSYHNYKRTEVQHNTLEQIGAVIKRGRLTYCDLKNSRLNYTHSNNLKKSNQLVKYIKKVGKCHDSYTARVGDILMCRVGKRCVGRVALIKQGCTIPTDCLYKISVSPKYRKVVWKSLTSNEGKEWIKVHAHGVCSQVISKSDLLNFPLFKLNFNIKNSQLSEICRTEV